MHLPGWAGGKLFRTLHNRWCPSQETSHAALALATTSAVVAFVRSACCGSSSKQVSDSPTRLDPRRREQASHILLEHDSE